MYIYDWSLQTRDACLCYPNLNWK